MGESSSPTLSIAMPNGFPDLPSLNALRVFEVVARHLNFRLAADELGPGVAGPVALDPLGAARAEAALSGRRRGLPYAAAAPAAEPVVRGQERSENRNFEIDRSVRYVVDPAPRMRRLTVGVAINDAIAAPGATAAPARRPLPAAEITRLTNLIQGTVGFDATRGDVVNLISTNFELPAAEVPTPIYLQPQFIDTGKYLAVALAIALAALLIIRPIMTKLTQVPAAADLAAAEAGHQRLPVEVAPEPITERGPRLHQAGDVLLGRNRPGLVRTVEHFRHDNRRQNTEDDHHHHDLDQGEATLAARAWQWGC